MIPKRRSLAGPRPGIGTTDTVNWTPVLVKAEKKFARDDGIGMASHVDHSRFIIAVSKV